MRLDARNGDCGWQVWHVPRARRMQHVVWVDDAADAGVEHREAATC